MAWFGNRRREGHEAETADVKPRNQILQMPEKQTSESKGKLYWFQNKSPEEQKKSLNEQAQAAKERQKLDRPNNNTSTEGDPNRGQRKRELGKETELG